MKRILITGVTGLVGDGICRYFLEKKWKVFGTSRNELHSLDPLFTPIKLDLNSPNDLSKLNECLPVDAIIHSAAKLPYTLKDKNDEKNYYKCNVDGTRSLLDWLITSKIKKFIFISSTGVCDTINSNSIETNIIKPKLNHYHISKAMGELLCDFYKASFPNITIMRIKAPYGYKENKSVFSKFIHLAKNNKNITLWGAGIRSQTFTFVEDIGFACELAINHKKSNSVYNIAGNETISMKELANKIINLVPNSESKVVFSDKPDPNQNEINSISFDKAKNEISYVPRFNIESGLNKIIHLSGKKFYRQSK